VALALLSGTALAALAWMHASLGQLDRALKREAEARLLANAHALALGIDFTSRPTGSEHIAGMKLEWTAGAPAFTNNSSAYASEHGDRWRVGLLRISVVAEVGHEGRPLRVAFAMFQAAPQALVVGAER
jgi:hypothetical protein